jgi:hypothetical protein
MKRRRGCSSADKKAKNRISKKQKKSNIEVSESDPIIDKDDVGGPIAVEWIQCLGGCLVVIVLEYHYSLEPSLELEEKRQHEVREDTLYFANYHELNYNYHFHDFSPPRNGPYVPVRLPKANTSAWVILARACSECHSETVRAVLQTIPTNLRKNTEYTQRVVDARKKVVRIAARRGNLECCALVLQHFCDRDSQDDVSLLTLAFGVAFKMGNRELFRYLLRWTQAEYAMNQMFECNLYGFSEVSKLRLFDILFLNSCYGRTEDTILLLESLPELKSGIHQSVVWRAITLKMCNVTDPADTDRCISILESVIPGDSKAEDIADFIVSITSTDVWFNADYIAYWMSNIRVAKAIEQCASDKSIRTNVLASRVPAIEAMLESLSSLVTRIKKLKVSSKLINAIRSHKAFQHIFL